MKSKWTQMKTKHNYDTWTKHLSSNKTKGGSMQHDGLVGVKRSWYDVPINSLRVGRTRPC